MQSPGPATLASALRRWAAIGAQGAFASIFLEHDPVGFQGQDNKNLINNRQAGRRRGRGGQQQRSQGGGNPGRLDTGNRIDNRARGNAAQLLEKYKTLARDAQMQGDRVNVEYYLQFADHYFRVLAETRARIEENGGPVQRRIQGATLDEDDTEFEDEGERVLPAEQPRGGQNGYRQDGNRSEGNRSDNSRQDGSRQDGSRQDGPRQDSYRQDGGRQDGARQDTRQDGNRNEPRQDSRGDGDRGYQRGGNRANGEMQNGSAEARGTEDQNDRPRRSQNGASQNGASQSEGGYDRQRGDTPRGADDRYAQSEPRTEEPTLDLAPVGAEAGLLPQTGATQGDSDAVEPPKRGRGRPRRDASATPAAAKPERRDADEDNGFSADLLPPSLNVSAVVPDEPDADGAEKPRRRRGRPPIVRETDPVA